MQVKINSYITRQEPTEEQAIENALKIVEAYDAINENRLGEEVVTKLYYIVPSLGKILVVVNDADKEILGVNSNVLANTNITDYPIERLPSNVIEYKELIIKKDSSLTAEQILNAGQSIAEEAAERTMPYKIPIVKVINYNTNEQSYLVMPSVFGDNIFNSISGIVNTGDADAGNNVITNGSFKTIINTYEEFELLENPISSIELPMKAILEDPQGKAGKFTRGAYVEFQVPVDDESIVTDLKGSVFEIKNAVKSGSSGSGFGVDAHAYGEIKNFSIKMSGERTTVIGNVKNYYGDDSKNLTFTNAKFDFSELSYDSLIYSNGPKIHFVDCNFTLPTKKINIAKNRAYADFTNCIFHYVDTNENETVNMRID